MTIFVWDPADSGSANGFEKGTAKHISTQGFKPTNHPLTVTTQGYIVPVLVNIDIQTGGAADAEFIQGGNVFAGEGTIFVDGMSPIVIELGGVVEFEYEPIGTIDVSGDAPWSIGTDGDVIYDYTSFGSKALIGGADEAFGYSYLSSGSLQIDGGSVTNIEMTVVPDGEIVLDGDAGIVFIPKDSQRGGRGVITTPAKRKAKILIPNIYIWYAPLLRRFALKLHGAADVEFEKGETFEFLKQLQTIDVEPVSHEPSFFRTINDYIRISPDVYNEVGVGEKAFSGDAKTEFVSAHEPFFNQEDLVLLLLLDEQPPVAYLTSDVKKAQIIEQNQAILDILDIL